MYIQTWFKNRRSAEKRRSESVPLPKTKQDYSPNTNLLNLSDDYHMMIQSHSEMDIPNSNLAAPYFTNMANNQDVIWTSENQYANVNVPFQHGADPTFDLVGTQPLNGYANMNVDYSQMAAQPAYNFQFQYPDVNHPNSWQRTQGTVAQHQYHPTYFQQPRNYGHYQAQQNQAPVYYRQNIGFNQIPSYQFVPKQNHNSSSFVSLLESDGSGGSSI